LIDSPSVCTETFRKITRSTLSALRLVIYFAGGSNAEATEYRNWRTPALNRMLQQKAANDRAAPRSSAACFQTAANVKWLSASSIEVRRCLPWGQVNRLGKECVRG